MLHKTDVTPRSMVPLPSCSIATARITAKQQFILQASEATQAFKTPGRPFDIPISLFGARKSKVRLNREQLDKKMSQDEIFSLAAPTVAKSVSGGQIGHARVDLVFGGDDIDRVALDLDVLYLGREGHADADEDNDGSDGGISAGHDGDGHVELNSKDDEEDTAAELMEDDDEPIMERFGR